MIQPCGGEQQVPRPCDCPAVGLLEIAGSQRAENRLSRYLIGRTAGLQGHSAPREMPRLGAHRPGEVPVTTLQGKKAGQWEVISQEGHQTAARYDRVEFMQQLCCVGVFRGMIISRM